jgi:hypothetical protein
MLFQAPPLKRGYLEHKELIVASFPNFNIIFWGLISFLHDLFVG